MGVSQEFVAGSGQDKIVGWVAGSGPTVLLLHGGPGMSDYSEMLLEEVAGWRAIGYQQRGLSPSTTTGPFTVERHVADAVAVLDAQRVRRTVVVGHSWGGHLALQLAVAHPERVRAAVTVDGLGVIGDGGISVLRDELRARLGASAREELEQLDTALSGDREAVESLKLLWPSYYAEPNHAPQPPGDLRINSQANSLTMTSVAGLLENDQFAIRLRKLDLPVTIVAGEQSPMPVEVARQTWALIAGGRLVLVPDAGHLPWHERPGCLARELASHANSQ